jgi:mannosyl-3-phosphoglycerate phosphatase
VSEPARAALLVATDLDGCLLDEETYSWAPAAPALAALRERGIPLVLATSKTRAEVEPLIAALGVRAPAIVENGGVITIPAGHLRRTPSMRIEGTQLIVVLGTAREALVRALADIAAQTGIALRGFASLSPEEVSRLTGLSLDDAGRALRRDYDEPFLVEGGEDTADTVRRAAASRGLLVSRGGRFHHLTGPVSKGRALQRLLALYAADGRRFTTLALGDSANDLSMLQQADRPVVVPRPGNVLDPVLSAALPGAERAVRPGPEGWNEAVLAVLAGRPLPRAATGPP